MRINWKLTMTHAEKKTFKKCRYFNLGFCKYSKKGCRFSHPKDICKEYLDTMKCETNGCGDRHPKMCKWLKCKAGCKRGKDCDFLK